MIFILLLFGKLDLVSIEGYILLRGLSDNTASGCKTLARSSSSSNFTARHGLQLVRPHRSYLDTA